MKAVLRQELERTLAEPVPCVIERQQNELDRLLDSCGRRVVLFGAGGVGRSALTALRSIGVEPLGFSDNDQTIWGTQIGGLPVHSPALAAQSFASDALFIVTIWNPRHWYSETRQQLERLGCRQITSPSPVYWRFAKTLLPFYAQDLPQRVYKLTSEVLRAGDIWADIRSQEEYLRQVRWRTHGECNFARPDGDESYFPDGIFQLSPEEVFVDCGAFDGDTIQALLNRQGGSFRHIFAVEPDAASFEALQTNVNALPPDIRRKITLLHGAIGAGRETSVAISDLVNGSTATYIKMDIEGAELQALTGARKVIERDRPVLAVCVYHNQHDLWQLPLLMKTMVPEYRMFLRCYEGDGWQTVAYAVPPERVISP